MNAGIFPDYAQLEYKIFWLMAGLCFTVLLMQATQAVRFRRQTNCDRTELSTLWLLMPTEEQNKPVLP